jgi:membrane protein implicated in regulation of membrane protease activity
MQASTIWWIFAGLTIAAELLSGTIYLLMISVGLAAGAIAAHWGLDWPGQISTAAVVGTLCILLGRRIRSARGPRLPAAANPDLNLDIGEIVHVAEWGADGTARIPYRGSTWTAALRPGTLPTAGSFRIVEIHGNRLLVDKA